MTNDQNNINELEAPNPEALEAKLAATEQQRDEYLAGWQRAKADFLNYKKEELRRLEEVGRYGNEDMIRELIVILDNFDLGIATLQKAGPVEKGIYMIRAQIEDILRKRGVQKLIASAGEEFNPKFQEAIAVVESDKPSGTVIEQIEPGYVLQDKVLRPARVKIAK